jgi:uncharacterized protein with HEPN domain
MTTDFDTILDATAVPAAESPSGDLMDDFVSSLTVEVTPAPAPETVPPKPPEIETPAAPAEVDTDEPAPEVPKNRKDWDVLRGSRDRWKTTAEETKSVVAAKEQTVAELTKKVEELQAKAARLPELEEKLQVFDEYEKELSVTRLEVTQEYKNTILMPLQAIGEAAETLAKANESDSEEILEVMREADPAKQRAMFKDATAGWDEVDKSELWVAVKDARILLDKQEIMRNNASAASKEQASMALRREEATKAEHRKAFEASLKDVSTQLREKTPFIPLLEGETADDRYALLEQRVSEVDFDSQTPRGKAFAAAAAILHPKMVQTVQKLQAEVNALKARVNAANSGKPSISAGNEGRAPDTEAQDFLVAMGVPTNKSY